MPTTLKETINKYTWADIESSMKAVLKDRAVHLNQSIVTLGYHKVFEDLKRLEPTPKKNLDRINVKMILDDLSPDESPYAHVCAYDDKDERWGISMTNWSEVLSLDFSWEDDFTEKDALCEVLWEITWYGFSNEDVQQFASNITKL
jgi:hypothetical protein